MMLQLLWNVSTYVTGTALPSAYIISTYFDQENLRSCPQNSVAQKSGGDEVLAFPRNDVVKRPELWAEGTINHGEKIKKQRGTLGAENLGTVGGVFTMKTRDKKATEVGIWSHWPLIITVLTWESSP